MTRRPAGRARWSVLLPRPGPARTRPDPAGLRPVWPWLTVASPTTHKDILSNRPSKTNPMRSSVRSRPDRSWDPRIAVNKERTPSPLLCSETFGAIPYQQVKPQKNRLYWSNAFRKRVLRSSRRNLSLSQRSNGSDEHWCS